MVTLPEEYLALKAERQRGFQTLYTYSVLTHVDMETGFSLSVCLKDAANGQYLKHALIGRKEEGAEIVTPEAHDFKCRYTSVKVEFQNVKFRVESCRGKGVPLLLLVTPLSQEKMPPLLVLEGGYLWNRPGVVAREKNALLGAAGEKRYAVYSTAPHDPTDPNLPTQAPYLATPMAADVAFSVNVRMTIEQARRCMAAAREIYREELNAFEPCRDCGEALMSALSWDTTYDATRDRVISPVSRLWSIGHGGYVLFCWDSYFAGFMAAEWDKFLAYSNLIEITLCRTQAGFVPNFADGTGVKSEDRSQPPVGSAMLLETYRIHREKWIVEFLFPFLLKWNEWFAAHRMEADGALCWGSDPYEPRFGNLWESNGVNERFGAALESGLDNSPMYDDIPFDSNTHRMQLKDVGLTGLYILDTRSLIALAGEIGREDTIPALQERLDKAENGLTGLWEEDFGFFLNRRTDTGEFSYRISPTNFYALFSDRITPEQRMRIQAHYENPKEFWGEWALPSIARNDPAFGDQNYWRGRIWAPMNFLVYLALCRWPDMERIRKDLADKSEKLLLKEWLEHRHVHENYNAVTGEGCDSDNSDRFYHWGALLGVVAMAEKGLFPGLGQSL